MDKKIKIIRIIARLNIGGPAINASILSADLDKKRFDTKVLYGSLAEGEAGLENMMRSSNVDMVLIPELGREISPIDDIRAFWKIVRIIRRERPDIVHTHTAKAGTLGRLAALFTGVKVRVHTFHGHVFRHYFSRLKTRLFIFIERILGLFTTKVIAISDRQKEDLVSNFKVVPDGKCVVVPLGLDLDRLVDKSPSDRSLKSGLGMRDGELCVGMIGRLVPIKNHEMFLKAAASISRRRPDLNVKYLIVGDGGLRPGLEKMAALLNINDKVIFMGWRADLSEIYSLLDIVALTSRNEGTPLALIEAMAMTKPVLATNVGGVPDIVEDGVSGILVKDNDEEGFVLSAIRLLEDEGLRARLGRAGFSKSRKFSRSNLVASMTKVYDDCLRSVGK